jgi:hypothetical protein
MKHNRQDLIDWYEDQKEKKQTVKMFGHDSDKFEQRLQELKKDFTVKMSNYSTVIEIGKFRYVFGSDFSEGTGFFGAYQKIKKDIVNAPYIDSVNERDLIYFDTAKMPDKLRLKNAYNVDIKSAYIKTAYNFGFISKETFDYCMKLPKVDRLKAFGMIATNYTCFDFKEGKIEKVYSKRDEETRKYFFAVVSEVSKVMQKIKNELGNDFLFYWVDGIYFKSKKAAIKAEELFKENHYETSFDVLKNFTLFADDFKYTIQFGKQKEQKIFTIPKIQKNENVTYQKNKKIKGL